MTIVMIEYRVGQGVYLGVIIVRTNIGPDRVSLSGCDYSKDEYRALTGCLSLIVTMVRTNIGPYRASLWL